MARALDMEREDALFLQRSYISVLCANSGRKLSLHDVFKICDKTQLLRNSGLQDRKIDEDAWELLWAGLKNNRWRICGVVHVKGSGRRANTVFYHDPERDKEKVRRPEMAVSGKKLQKVIAAAKNYIMDQGKDGAVRDDILKAAREAETPQLSLSVSNEKEIIVAIKDSPSFIIHNNLWYHNSSLPEALVKSFIKEVKKAMVEEMGPKKKGTVSKGRVNQLIMERFGRTNGDFLLMAVRGWVMLTSEKDAYLRKKKKRKTRKSSNGWKKPKASRVSESKPGMVIINTAPNGDIELEGDIEPFTISAGGFFNKKINPKKVLIEKGKVTIFT